MPKSDNLVKYLACESHDKKWVSDKLIYLLAGDPVIPPFSAAAICECMQAHLEVIRAVWYHHDPFNTTLDSQPDNSKFLSACVAVADALVNYKQLNIFGARIMDYDKPFEELPEWKFLGQYQMSCGLELDLDKELEEAKSDLKSFGL